MKFMEAAPFQHTVSQQLQNVGWSNYTLSKHFTLIVWDMRGHGQSDYPDDEKLYNEEETIEE